VVIVRSWKTVMRRTVAFLAPVVLATGCGASFGEPSAGPPESACDGLTDAVVTRAIDELRANVEVVEPLREAEGPKAVPHTVGAVVRVHATPGMTAPWVGRVLRCDTARRPVEACAAAEACALTPPGASSSVTSTPTGFAISVRSRDRDVAHEIARRASGFARPAWPSSLTTARAP
jgi:hypothetical protein